MGTFTTSHISVRMLSASADSLSSTLALIEEVSLTKVAWSKGKDFLDSSQSDSFLKTVEEKSQELRSLPNGELLLKIIGALQDLMRLPPRDFRTSFDLEEVADDICVAAVKILRADKRAQFTGNNLPAMIEFQMAKIFGGLSVRMEEMSSKQRDDLVSKVQNFLASLPADKQRFIMDRLGVAELSEAAVRKAIASGALWTAFTAAVQVFGFAFYTTAAHLLAVLSLHLLPFGAYVGLSSAIAVLSSPWMLPVLLGIGWWSYAKHNQSFRESMVPLFVTGLCLSGMAVDSETPAAGEIVRREAVSRWQEARAVRERMRKNTYQAKLARSESEQVLSATRNRISQARSAMETAAKKKEGLEKRRDTLITAAETDISNGLWGTALISAATKVKELQSSIESRRAERKGRPGLLQKFGDSLNIWSLEGELQNAREVLSQTVRSASINRRSYPGDLILLFASIDQAVCQITSLRADLDRLRAEERENSSDLITATSRLARAEKKQDVSEHRYFGLGLV